MHILVVSAVYPPEPVLSAMTSEMVVQEAVRRGHTVSVVTAFPNRPAGVIYQGYHRKFLQKEQKRNLQVIRCFSFLSRESTLLSRFFENISFGLVSFLVVMMLSRPDVIYANTWPVFASGFIRLAASLRHIPLVTSIQDIYPESILVQKRIGPKSILYRWLRRVDRWIARGSQ